MISTTTVDPIIDIDKIELAREEALVLGATLTMIRAKVSRSGVGVGYAFYKPSTTPRSKRCC